MGQIDSQSLLADVLSEGTAVAGGDAGLIGVWDHGSQKLVVTRNTLSRPLRRSTRVEQAIARAVEKRAQVIMNGLSSGWAEHAGAAAVLAAPLIHRERLVGVVAIVSETRRFSPEDAQALYRAASLAASQMVAITGGTRAVAAETGVGTAKQRPARLATLPHVGTTLIGRESDLDELEAGLWQVDSGPLTLVGPPGVGKTRLASALAARVAERLANQVAFVDLAAVDSPTAALRAIAQALGLEAQAGLEEVARATEHRELLLILDTFEHVLAAAPEMRSLNELAQLTPRERQVAVLVARGLRNQDIATQLGMQRKTAERHVGHLLEKLGMSSRVQLAGWALRQGLVEEHSPQ